MRASFAEEKQKNEAQQKDRAQGDENVNSNVSKSQEIKCLNWSLKLFVNGSDGI